MDLYLERQYIGQMKEGNTKQFLALYDAYFEKVYAYVARRIASSAEVERITRLTFMDALGQVQNTPTDLSYDVWLYSLAKPRVFAYINKAGFSDQPAMGGSADEKVFLADENLAKAKTMMTKLLMEEREIIKLKFFEQVSDADVMFVLGTEDAAIGTKIYRVLKRASFLIFGESDEKRGVYFGELSSLLEKLRAAEKISETPALKLSLRTDLANKIEKKNFAVEAEAVEEKEPLPATNPWATGSNDPAKIFVEAVKEMKEDEAKKKQKEAEAAEFKEALMATFDRWKGILIAAPIVLFLAVGGYVAAQFIDFSGIWDDLTTRKIAREVQNACEIDVNFEGDFTAAIKSEVNNQINNKICDHFEGVKSIKLVKKADEKLQVNVDIKDWFLEYRFVKKINDWRIKRYERTPVSDQKSGQV